MARARTRSDEAEMAPFQVETPGSDEPPTPNFAGSVKGNPMKGQALWMAVCVLGLGLIAVGILKLLYWRRNAAPGLDLARPDDLWAIHDLLLAGYAGIFMKPNSIGLLEVRTASKRLTALLPAIHPLDQCRQQFAETLGGTVGSPVPVERVTDEMQRQAALDAWDCLPSKFKANDFTDPFLPDAIGNFEAYKAAKMTVPKRTLKGVCGLSPWPRTCSFWVSMHLLAARADLLLLGHQLLDAMVPILAGGATFCGGCTKHFRALTKPMLSDALVQDFSDVWRCSAPHEKDPLECTEADLKEEIGDILKFRELLKSLPQPPSMLPSANASGTPPKSIAFTVLGVLHNMVTYTVSKDYTEPGRRAFVCVAHSQRDAMAFWSLRDDSTADAISQLEVVDFGVSGLLGLAKSREPYCADLM